MIKLFTTYYDEQNPQRRSELRTCLKKNSRCKSISKIYVLSEVEKDDFLLKNNVKFIEVSRRPVFKDFINIVNSVTSEGDINIISNADIYFDRSLDILAGILLKNCSFALTRWDVGTDGRTRLTELSNSQDSWIFQGSIRGIEGNFPIGVPGCDNRLAYEIRKAGYRLSNPSISIKTPFF